MCEGRTTTYNKICYKRDHPNTSYSKRLQEGGLASKSKHEFPPTWRKEGKRKEKLKRERKK